MKAYRRAAADADVLIAEVGAWSNPLSPDDGERRAALDKCKRALGLTDELGASTAVNITGSRGKRWDGHDRRNFTRETFDMIVQTVREIVDEVRPAKALYSLETMPWMYPNSADSYLELLEAIDRPAVGVHFDPVNLICSAEVYYSNGAMIRDFMAKLGARIVSCHAKDSRLGDTFTTHLFECRPGTGALDYRTFLTEIRRTNSDLPVLIEHLETEEEYDQAATYIRGVARELACAI